jgi:hypothetical protein
MRLPEDPLEGIATVVGSSSFWGDSVLAKGDHGRKKHEKIGKQHQPGYNLDVLQS